MMKQKKADKQPHLNFNALYLTTAFLWKGAITKRIVALYQRVTGYFLPCCFPSTFQVNGIALFCILLSPAKKMGFVYAKCMAFQRKNSMRANTSKKFLNAFHL